MQPWKGSRAREHIFDRRKYGKSEKFDLSCLNVLSMSSTQETVPSRAATLPYHDAESYKLWLNKIACERLGYEELQQHLRSVFQSQTSHAHTRSTRTMSRHYVTTMTA